ncbi:unnamed protein product [Prunus armeniaca]
MVSGDHTFDHLIDLDLPPVFDRCSDGSCEICCDYYFTAEKVFDMKLLKQIECIEEVVENYVNLHIAIVNDSIALFNSHDTFEVVEYIDCMRVENFRRHNATTLVDTIIHNIWFKRLAVKSLHNWRIFKYSKYLFLWSGRFQFEDQQSMIMILIQEGINSRTNFCQPEENDADKKRLFMEFNVGDFVWAILTKDRFPVVEYNKLTARKIGPMEILEKINPNAYRLKLPSHVRMSDVFNVKYLVPFHGSNSDDNPNSRANFCQPREYDAASLANTHMDHWDHVHA